jgi:3',5'-cyclic AMP phosphodiesterase CpdA
MNEQLKRRDLLALMGVGGLVFASGLAGCAERAAGAPATAGGVAPPPPPPSNDFFFLQLSDTHVGYQGPANPEAAGTLEHAVSVINAVDTQPDFIVFTGDLTHTTDDDAERRTRMQRFKQTISTLKVKDIRFLPGEHDAAPDHGAAYRELFGDLNYSFDHKGVHFVALDNVSRSGAGMGDEQLDWLAKDLAALPATTPLVVLAHRPLFDLQPDWDWFTKDGAKALEILSKRDLPTTVFYGHIHQEIHRTTGKITHHSARSLVFPLPAPGSQPKRAPLPWDPASPDHGLGWRAVAMANSDPRLTEVAYK